MSNKELSPKWKARFEHIEKYIEQKDNITRKEKSKLYRELPFSVRFNFFAFFFTIFYFLFLGLWRKGLSLLAISFVILFGIEIILQILEIDTAIINGVSIALGALYASTANTAYYYHIVKGSKSWNPFEGI